MKDFCREKQKEFQKKKIENNRNRKLLDEGSIAKRIKLDPSDVIEKNLAFIRCNFLKDTDLPKTLLHVHINNVLKCRASYITEQNSKLFRSIITVQGKKYSSTFWEKNKKNAEQGAALVCLLHLGLVNEKDLIENGTMIED